MDCMKISRALKTDADRLLRESGIDRVLRSYGTVQYVGSYALDLMAWPDVDVELVLKNGQSIETCFQLGSEVAQIPGVFDVHFQNFMVRHREGLPHPR